MKTLPLWSWFLHKVFLPQPHLAVLLFSSHMHTSYHLHKSVHISLVFRALLSFFWPSHTTRSDKVGILTHAYPHKPLRKTEVSICNHQVDSPLYCGLLSAVVICKQRKESGHTWYWIFLTRSGVIKQRKLKIDVLELTFSLECCCFFL